MGTKGKTLITVGVEINAPIGKVWKFWTTPEDIVNWNNASDDWHTPQVNNDLRVGGTFNYRMEAKDGSMGFDFEGIYNTVKTNEKIEYTLGDDRKVNLEFTGNGDKTKVVETFEAESTNLIEMQRDGWQAILDNFKKYAEVNK